MRQSSTSRLRNQAVSSTVLILRTVPHRRRSYLARYRVIRFNTMHLVDTQHNTPYATLGFLTP